METEFEMKDERARGCQVCLDPLELITGELQGLPACEACCEHARHMAATPERAVAA